MHCSNEFSRERLNPVDITHRLDELLVLVVSLTSATVGQHLLRRSLLSL
jgi:hypothetical protein